LTRFSSFNFIFLLIVSNNFPHHLFFLSRRSPVLLDEDGLSQRNRSAAAPLSLPKGESRPILKTDCRVVPSLKWKIPIVNRQSKNVNLFAHSFRTILQFLINNLQF